MTEQDKDVDWEALKLAIKIDNAQHAMEEAKAKGNKSGAEKMHKSVRELEKEAKNLSKGDK